MEGIRLTFGPIHVNDMSHYVVVDGNGIFLTGNVKAVWNFVVVNVAENSLTTIS